MDPLTALRRIAFLLERSQAPSAKVKAFRRAASVASDNAAELDQRVANGTLRDLPGIGASTAAVITEAVRGQTPAYLANLLEAPAPAAALDEAGLQLLGSLRGDLHSHSDWSDGGSPIEEMAVAAIELGRDYLALTDHSPRLTVANGLTPARLERQLDVVATVDEQLPDFRLLSGIEVDILDDGSLDQEAELLARLGVVVASVHSKLAMDSADMTRRLLRAVADPHIDVLGHCTGRLVGGRSRAQSKFDHAAVFTACADRQVAVEINCRPDRLDPPRVLLRQAVELGCLFSIDTDAHAPGQLDWLANGVSRAVECGVPPERIVTTWPVEQLLDWTERAR